MKEKIFVRDVEKVARSLRAKGLQTNRVIRDFMKGIDAHVSFLRDSRHSMEAMLEESVGSREEKSLLEAIDRLDRNIDSMEQMVKCVEAHYKRMR